MLIILKLLPIFFLLLLSYFAWVVFGNPGVCRTLPLVNHLGNLTYDLDTPIPKSNTDSLNQRLKDLVISKGYTWEQWLKNDIPRDIKWEITKQNSINILEYLKGVNNESIPDGYCKTPYPEGQLLLHPVSGQESLLPLLHR